MWFRLIEPLAFTSTCFKVLFQKIDLSTESVLYKTVVIECKIFRLSNYVTLLMIT